MVVRREVPCDGNDMDIVWKIRGNMEGRILLAAFSGTSSEMLLEGMQEDKLFLPSDMQRDGELLTASIAQKSYRYVICFGQKPVLQNKVKIERRALRQENAIYTEFPCDALKQLFEKMGLRRNCRTVRAVPTATTFTGKDSSTYMTVNARQK